MPPQGRLGDLSTVPADAHGCPGCPHPAIGPAINGSPNVKVNARPALRVNDKGVHAACCGPNMWTAVTGAPTVFINGRKAHRVADVDAHCGGKGMLVTGSPNVIVGGAFSIGGLAGGLAGNLAGSLAGGLAGSLGAAAAGALAAPIAGIANALGGVLGPIGVAAVQGALTGAVQGAVSGAVAGVAQGGGLKGALQGALQGAKGGAVQGAISGAVAGLKQELAKTLDDVKSDVNRDIAKQGGEGAFNDKKQALLNSPDVKKNIEAAGDNYRSDLNKQYGAMVESMTGGRISADEAMMLNPSGGLAGPGNFGVDAPGAIGRHAVRHDAQGFLQTNFDVGPGYGGALPGLPVSGQVVGALRELVNPTELPVYKEP